MCAMIDRFMIATLSELLAVTREGEQGFRACAQCARDPILGGVLEAQARRYQLASIELTDLVSQWNADPGMRVRFLCAARRGWMHLRASMALENDQALLDECERSENHAMEVYRNALDDRLPEGVQQILQRQFERLM